jgi:hypothetical protein
MRYNRKKLYTNSPKEATAIRYRCCDINISQLWPRLSEKHHFYGPVFKLAVVALDENTVTYIIISIEQRTQTVELGGKGGL